MLMLARAQGAPVSEREKGTEQKQSWREVASGVL